MTPDEGHRDGFGIKWLFTEPLSGAIPGGEIRLGVRANISSSWREWSVKEIVQFDIDCEEPLMAEKFSKRYVYPL